ncbi:hypothetical protein [Paenibacillus sp. PK3_47]|uniref:hypothetical protein n=1 Tax=Paenibacillus sp. PK3_47 TaxID=2072642 RepID=UPI00201E09E7|nr:hypothetical protein [Paenibacillus sp. PK3_47]
MRKAAGFAAALLLALLAGCASSTDADNANSNPSAYGGINTAGTTDEVTFAPAVNNNLDFKKAVGKNGTWVVSMLNDLTFTEELVVEGNFTNREQPARKIALYSQDAEHNIAESFILTAPKMTIRSENTQLQGGIFTGNVYVEANGFSVVNATINGNVYFANEQYQSTFSTANQGIVSGVAKVKK